MDNYIIYMHRNKINGKVYIGKTCQEPEQRFGSNGIGYRAYPYFYHAIQKYGWENFSHYILHSKLTADEANKLEQETIALYNATDKNHGYNLRSGGDGFDSQYSKNLWQNEDYRNRIIQANKEIWSNEERNNARTALMKEAWKDPEKRKRRSNMAKERWADEEFHKKAQKAVLEACKTAVICIETNERFNSVKEACEKYNMHHSNVCRAIREVSRCKGFHWKYAL